MGTHGYVSPVLVGRLRMIGVVLSFLLSVGSSVGLGDDLSKIRTAFDFARSGQASLDLRETRTSKLQSEPVLIREDVKCSRNGDWWGVQIKRSRNGKLDLYHQTNILFRGDDGLLFNSTQGGGHEQKTNQVESASLYSPSIAKTRDNRDRIWPSSNLDLLCFGILDGQPLCSPDGLLADAKVVGEENGLIKVGANSRFGKLLLWCDPERQYLPRRAEFVQAPESYTKGRKIADIVMNAGNVWPAGRIKEVRWSVDLDTSSADSDLGRPYISSWRIVKQTLCEAGVTVNDKIDVKVGSFKPGESGKPAEFLFGLKIPKLFKVQVMDAEHLSYRWDGDWAVPDASALQPSGVAASGAIWRILGVANLTLLLVVGIVVFLKYLKKTPSGKQK